MGQGQVRPNLQQMPHASREDLRLQPYDLPGLQLPMVLALRGHLHLGPLRLVPLRVRSQLGHCITLLLVGLLSDYKIVFFLAGTGTI